MTAKQALAVVAAAERRGISREAIAAKLCCSTDTLRKWPERPKATVSRAIAANVVALEMELAAMEATG